jgi:hypothetical protein
MPEFPPLSYEKPGEEAMNKTTQSAIVLAIKALVNQSKEASHLFPPNLRAVLPVPDMQTYQENEPEIEATFNTENPNAFEWEKKTHEISVSVHSALDWYEEREHRTTTSTTTSYAIIMSGSLRQRARRIRGPLA